MSLHVIEVTSPNTSYGLSLAPLVTLSKFKAPITTQGKPTGYRGRASNPQKTDVRAEQVAIVREKI